MSIFRVISNSALLVALGGCATGSTHRSGVGDRLIQRPPYYAGSSAAGDTTAIGHLPIAYQRGATQEPLFDPAGHAGTPVAALLSEMTAFLDSLRVTVPVATGGRGAPPGTPPDVRFSCETDASGDCVTGEGALGRDDIAMRLAVGRPSADWVAWAGGVMNGAGVARALVITLEVGQYRMRQRGLRGDKEVELGTGHTASLPWLTSLETPLNVLQLTGALVDRDGRAVRIGAEGLLAQRTSLPASALGAQRLISDAEVEQVRAARRDDLPGRPLAWQVALRTLVTQLTGREPR